MTTPEQADYEARSIAELEAGRLPLRAQQRIASIRDDQSFTSALTVDEHRAIRSVGFTPVGQVLGCCVYQIGYTGMWNCGYWGYGAGGLGLGRGFGGGYGGYVAQVQEAVPMREALYDARERAIERMRQECAGLGGDGVVAVRLSHTAFPAGGVEFRAIGTAVRAAGDVHPSQPFTCDLTGQDFAKLLRAGWLPCAFALGVCVAIRHDDMRTAMQARSWTNTEVTGLTELVHAARAGAREWLRRDVARYGGTHVVQREIELHIGEQPCRYGTNEGHDHVAEALVIGTALAPLPVRPGAPAPPRAVPMLRLR